MQPTRNSRHPTARRALALGGLVLAGVVVFGLWPEGRDALARLAASASQTDPGAVVRGLRDYLLGFGRWAALVSALLMVLQCVIAPIPGVIVTLANGMLFGWAWGGALSWSSAMVGAAVCFGIGRALGRPVVERLVGGTRVLGVSDLFFERYGHRAVLVCRLLPFVSFDVISYGAGLTSMRLRSFLIATGIGQLPATVVFSVIGAGLVDAVPTHFWAGCIVLAAGLVIWSIVSPWLRRVGEARRARRVAADTR